MTSTDGTTMAPALQNDHTLSSHPHQLWHYPSFSHFCHSKYKEVLHRCFIVHSSASELEFPFVYLSTISMESFFKSFTHFSIRFFFYLLWMYRLCLYIWNTSLDDANILSWSVIHMVITFVLLFNEQVLFLCSQILYYFLLWIMLLSSCLRSPLPKKYH